MQGFSHRAVADLPDWAISLQAHYWRVRVEARNKTMRRKHYRYIAAEKLRLVEAGICPHKINAVCKYLVSLKQVNADRLHAALESETKQLSFNFEFNNFT